MLHDRIARIRDNGSGGLVLPRRSKRQFCRRHWRNTATAGLPASPLCNLPQQHGSPGAPAAAAYRFTLAYAEHTPGYSSVLATRQPPPVVPD